jgi:hypothetical protein
MASVPGQFSLKSLFLATAGIAAALAVVRYVHPVYFAVWFWTAVSPPSLAFLGCMAVVATCIWQSGRRSGQVALALAIPFGIWLGLTVLFTATVLVHGFC